jgi:hypothetical protein
MFALKFFNLCQALDIDLSAIPGPARAPRYESQVASIFGLLRNSFAASPSILIQWSSLRLAVFVTRSSRARRKASLCRRIRAISSSVPTTGAPRSRDKSTSNASSSGMLAAIGFSAMTCWRRRKAARMKYDRTSARVKTPLIQ